MGVDVGDAEGRRLALSREEELIADLHVGGKVGGEGIAGGEMSAAQTSSWKRQMRLEVGPAAS